MQIIAGPGDFYWHELFGVDGLLSPTHLALALGIIMASVGATIGFARIHSEMEQKKLSSKNYSANFIWHFLV